MQTESRAAPHLMLGALTVLAVAAIWLSLATAPPNAQQQLRSAAANTVAATSFVLTDTITLTPASGAPSEARQEVARVVYHSPDRVQETVTVNGRSLTVLAIGSARYERSDNGAWVALGSRDAGSVPVGRQAAQGVVAPMQELTTATDVVRHGDWFTFVPSSTSTLLGELIGSAAASLPPGSTSFRAALSGEYVRELDVLAHSSSGRITVLLTLGSFDAAPDLAPPPASRITPSR